jgi:hypothetical protein
MNAAETVQTAIDKLTRLRNESAKANPFPWSVYDHLGDPMLVSAAPEEYGHPVSLLYEDSYSMDPAWWHTETAELVVALHATIDAQLDLLWKTLEFVKSTPGATSHEGPVIDLALAILGKQATDD